MDTNAYVAFLVIGALIVLVDGQFVYHSGKRYLANGQGESESGASMARLVAVLFHIATLGVLALISTIDFPGGTTPTAIVGRVGVFLLVLALAHGITIAVLSRQREEQVVEQINTRMNTPRPADHSLNDPVVSPVPGQEGRDPRVSPSIESGTPYTTDRY
ncbi:MULTISPECIES: hypothetical protein [Amycolatopsis]|uniref:Integral membrane protein n=1 Tax=Amycolatopsis thermalba TaxID=944492 RepID=A0ABY4P5E7_9PSEU|nr:MULTISPECIES: hypothetical protein [Amycolatopsis]OXM72047.1 hypothetical protein CF166_16990 [Amycolatopsis sp. KNN50.9b]UQS27544.1 hypothetical protein L1857_34475 [Amycolatopsis thermalba]